MALYYVALQFTPNIPSGEVCSPRLLISVFVVIRVLQLLFWLFVFCRLKKTDKPFLQFLLPP
jgi:hypothetical protein